MMNRVRRDDLNASIAAFRAAPAEIKKRLADASRTDLTAAWVQEIKSPPHSFSNAQVEIISTGAFAVASNNGVTAWAGVNNRYAAKRNAPDPRAFEFGSLDRNGYTEYYRVDKRRKSRGAFKVRRRTSRQVPTRSTKGWIAYPAKDRFASRVGKLYGAIVAKVLHDATEGKMS